MWKATFQQSEPWDIIEYATLVSGELNWVYNSVVFVTVKVVSSSLFLLRKEAG